MDKKVKIVILAATQNDKGEILISQRSDPKVPESHLKWDLVGGANEFGEDPKATAAREVLEEAGLTVRVGELFPEAASRVWQHDDYLFQAFVLCYRCELTGGELSSKDPKIADLRWVKKEELEAYEFLPTTKVFIDLIRQSA